MIDIKTLKTWLILLLKKTSYHQYTLGFERIFKEPGIIVANKTKQKPENLRNSTKQVVSESLEYMKFIIVTDEYYYGQGRTANKTRYGELLAPFVLNSTL